MKRNNSIKAIISLSLVLVIICSFAVPAFAAEEEEPTVQPRWTSIANMELCMSFVGNEGNVSGIARKQSTSSLIVGTLYLYKWNGTTYEYMDEVSGFKTVGTLCLSIDFVCEKGVQYLGILSVVAYTNNIGEEHTIEYLETCK